MPSAYAAKTPGVGTGVIGVTRSTAGAGARTDGIRATRSPRPSTSAQPAARKNGTSDPTRVAAAWRPSGETSAPHASNAASRAAAPSLLPPASPAATGIRFSSRHASGGTGIVGPSSRRAASRASATARRTRFDSAGPQSAPSTVSVSDGPIVRATETASARASGTMTEWSS